MSDPHLADRPKADSLRPLRALWPFIVPYKRTLVFAMVALVVAAAAMLALPVALRFVIDEGFAANNLATINRYFGWFLGAGVAFGGFAALRYYLVTWLGERVVADLRSAVYDKVVRMDPAFFEVTRIGEVQSRLTTDTTLVQSISGVGLSIALRSSLNLTGGLIMLAVTSIKLMGLIVLLMPVVIVPLLWLGRRIRGLSRTAQDRIADTSGLAGESLNAIETVQAFTLEDDQSDRYRGAVMDSFGAAIRRIRMSAGLSAMAVTLVFSGITFILWMGARAVLAGEMTGGELAQFLMYAMVVGGSAAALAEMWGEVQRAAGAMERLTELLHAEPNIRPPENPAELAHPAQGRIAFEDVDFHYPSRPEDAALDGVSLVVEPGETVAIVGPSGAGKTTTFSLLLRFYDAASGRVTVDGVDITRLDPRALRQQVGLVAQETVLFGDTARENIRYGRPDASDFEVEQAATAAAADEFIQALPEGFDTHLGERGTRLSGGQRQRIAIARAILKDPPILLLDEATSSLDSESERLVQTALEGLMENRTTLIIAHRLATVKKVDRIIVMNHGRIVATGTHKELLETDPLYARLASLQFGNE